MKVLLATIGSRGDVQPLAVLGEALLAAGHEVVLAGSPDGAPIARDHGVPFVECGRDVTKWLADLEVAKMSPLRVMAELRALLRAELEQQAPVLFEAAHGASVVVSAGLQALGRTIAEAREAAALYVHYSPTMIFSREHPPLFIANQRLPGLVNRALHSASGVFFDRVLMPYLNVERQKLGLARTQKFFRALPADVLLAWDPLVAAVPADATAIAARLGAEMRLHHVGALLPPARPLADEVVRFLEEPGAAPCVYVGFGSMPDQQPAATRALVAAAARAAGVRAIFHSPALARAASTAAERSQEGVLVVEGASHASLFPRVRAIVHHAGSGTTATAARAGVPQVAVPHFVDQPLWSERLRRRGVCAAVLPRPKLDAASLAAALRRCLDDGDLRANALSLRDTLVATEPLAAAVRVVEDLERARSA